MRRLYFLVLKEFQLLLKDPHGLLLLFLMPSVFVLIMTFALQNQYAVNSEVRLDYFTVNNDEGPESRNFLDQLEKSSTFHRIESAEPEEELTRLTAADEVKFLLQINNNFDDRLLNLETAVEVKFAPGTSTIFANIIEAQLRNQLSRIYLQSQSASRGDESDQIDKLQAFENTLTTASLYQAEKSQFPSSVQQNVPAWLLFAMFFIAIPLSTTMINERNQGTLNRLRSMDISSPMLLAGKFIPYFCINLLQASLMLLIGLYLVPLLGGDALSLGRYPASLLIIVTAASFAAVNYALFIAQIAKTIEQATIFAAVFNIIMAAVGGVMVPRFIMPVSMQSLSEFSPMAWGLDGFFDILLRNGGALDVIPETIKLLAFSLLMLCLTLWASSPSRNASH